MSQFGESYRKETQDANAGRIQRNPQAVTSKRGTGVQEQESDLEFQKEDRLASLITTVGSAASNFMNNKAEREYKTAVATGSQKKLDTLNEQKTFWSALAGNSATYRGFQHRVVGMESERAYNKSLAALPEDIKEFDTLDKYMASTSRRDLEESLSKQTDDDTREQITTAYTKNAAKLSGQYIRQRKVYEQVLTRRSALDGIGLAGDSIRAAIQTTDEELVDTANTDAQAAFKKPRDLDQPAWESVVIEALQADLALGNTELMTAAEASGAIDGFSAESLEDLAEYKSEWNQQYSRDYYAKASELADLVVAQDDSFPAQLAAYKQRYPSVDSGKWLKAWEKEEIKENQRKQILASDTIAVRQGRGKELTKKRRTAAFMNSYTQRTEATVLRERKAAHAKREITDDQLNDAISPQERKAAAHSNPQPIVSMWASNKTEALPVMKGSMASIANISGEERITADQENVLTKEIKFMSGFLRRDRPLLAKHFSKREIGHLVAYDKMMNGSGWSARESLLALRTGRNNPMTEEERAEVDYDAEAFDAVRAFSDARGFENFTGWSSDPDNVEALKEQAKWQFAAGLKMFNNIDLAQDLVSDFLANESTKVGNKLILHGQKLDLASENGSYDNWMTLVENTEKHKDRWEDTGFPREMSMRDDSVEMTVRPDGKAAIFRGHNVNGGKIYFELKAPNELDLRAANSDQIKHLELIDHGTNFVGEVTKAGATVIDNIFSTPDLPDASELFTPKAQEVQAAPLQANQISSVVQDILKSEGGLSMTSKDPGNFNSDGDLVGTNHGISAKFLEKKLGRVPTKEDVAAVTLQQAADWHTENIDTEKREILKRVDKTLGDDTDLLFSHMATMTSRVGNLKVLRDPQLPDNANVEELAAAYIRFLKKLPNWKDSGKGWTNRINDKIAQSKR